MERLNIFSLALLGTRKGESIMMQGIRFIAFRDFTPTGERKKKKMWRGHMSLSVRMEWMERRIFTKQM
ncbi:hypothetical protein ACSS6W_001648 [Trichoderma asperelloides]